MQSFFRAAIAKSYVEKMAPIDGPLYFWTTLNRSIEVDPFNRFVLVDGSEIFKYDFIWIEELSRFLSVAIGVNYRDPWIQLVCECDLDEVSEINLFLFPWSRFPVWPDLV
jgi:hypothetical protein